MAENILLKIKENLKNFSFAEKRIAVYVLNNQNDVLQMSIKELADACETSQATIVRFSRTVGATGFSDFKIRLSALQNLDKTLLEEISPDEDLSTVKEKLTVRIQQTLSDTNKTLNDSTINEVVKLIDKSKSISVYGMGSSLLAASDFAQKFGRLGLTPFVGHDVDEVIAHVVNQEVPGLFIVISNSGERPLLKNLLKSIPEEIKTVVLTKTPKSSLAKCADYVLNYSATSFPNKMRTSETTSLLAQLYSIDLLYYRYFQNNFEKHFFQIQNSYEKTHGPRKK
ncbi:MurR/RpiR family transcriptional regulator [Xylocopilactobacillus apis]|uniref:RpiR family transcriptional regulator n=1 Tax=Xylocopilactobacillus apis TaxID=2932183 RepID=A0AAU9D0W8_9LACO|nr:MurR/RpiR family transcriptional regulator [Xylocopilactobacillus apis]BDR56126.1 RpiR family transcriptional regulator [Xylocopilactobacillus apis]